MVLHVIHFEIHLSQNDRLGGHLLRLTARRETNGPRAGSRVEIESGWVWVCVPIKNCLSCLTPGRRRRRVIYPPLWGGQAAGESAPHWGGHYRNVGSDWGGHAGFWLGLGGASTRAAHIGWGTQSGADVSRIGSGRRRMPRFGSGNRVTALFTSSFTPVFTPYFTYGFRPTYVFTPIFTHVHLFLKQ